MNLHAYVRERFALMIWIGPLLFVLPINLVAELIEDWRKSREAKHRGFDVL
jgi:hypothetical protein